MTRTSESNPDSQHATGHESNEGEGSRRAAREYNKGATTHASSGMSDAAARDARRAVESDENSSLREAEAHGKRAAKGEDPMVSGKPGDDAYPRGFADLDEDARQHALERATELIEQGYTDVQAMRMSVTLAEEWVDNGKAGSQHGVSGPAQHIMHERQGWIICREDRAEPTHTFNRLEDALHRAHELATDFGSSIYIYDSDGALIDKYETYGTSNESLQEEHIYHVIPSDDGWALQRGGQDGMFKRFDTKKDALSEAREVAGAVRATVVVHYKTGEVQRQMTYSGR